MNRVSITLLMLSAVHRAAHAFADECDIGGVAVAQPNEIKCAARFQHKRIE